MFNSTQLHFLPRSEYYFGPNFIYQCAACLLTIISSNVLLSLIISKNTFKVIFFIPHRPTCKIVEQQQHRCHRPRPLFGRWPKTRYGQSSFSFFSSPVTKWVYKTALCFNHHNLAWNVLLWHRWLCGWLPCFRWRRQGRVALVIKYSKVIENGSCRSLKNCQLPKWWLFL